MLPPNLTRASSLLAKLSITLLSDPTPLEAFERGLYLTSHRAKVSSHPREVGIREEDDLRGGQDIEMIQTGEGCQGMHLQIDMNSSPRLLAQDTTNGGSSQREEQAEVQMHGAGYTSGLPLRAERLNKHLREQRRKSSLCGEGHPRFRRSGDARGTLNPEAGREENA
jgi:hypothetical protein